MAFKSLVTPNPQFLIPSHLFPRSNFGGSPWGECRFVIPFESFGLNEELGMKVAASPQIYILQRSCHHNPELINLNPEP